MLQGVGPAEFRKYGMRSLTGPQLADLAGNSFLGYQVSESKLITSVLKGSHQNFIYDQNMFLKNKFQLEISHVSLSNP